MKRLFLALLLTCQAAFAQVAPFQPNQVLTASALNNALANAQITAGTINGTTLGATVPASGIFTTLGASTFAVTGTSTFGAQITSLLPNGSPPFVINSSTNIPNLNASTVNGFTFAAPGAIGGTTPGTGAFTTLSTSGLLSANLGATVSGGRLLVSTGATSNQLRLTQTTAPTCTTNCGTSPTVAGSDSAMIVTMGASGVPASGWVITFNGTWVSAPACIVQSALSTMVVGKMPIAVVATQTTITVTTNGTAPATSDKYQIQCIGIL